MKTQQSEHLETSSRDGQLDQFYEDEFDYPVPVPSLEKCFEQFVLDKKDGISARCLLNSPEYRRKQIALLLSSIPSQFLLERPPELKEAYRAELRYFIANAEREGSLTRLLDLQEECYKYAVTLSVDKAILHQNESHCHQLELGERRLLVDGLLARRSILGFRQLEEAESISRADCIGFWEALSQNKDIRNFMRYPSLKQQATESVALLLKYFIKGEDPDTEEELQKQLLKEIITKKSLTCLKTNEQIELSRQNKYRLISWIHQIEVFKRFCNADDGPLVYAKAYFGWSLLRLFSPNRVIIHPKDKYQLIEKLMEDPHTPLYQFNLNPEHLSLLQTELKYSTILKDYLKQMSVKPLRVRKLADIDKIIQALQVPEYYHEEVSELLDRYEFVQLYSHTSIRNRFIEAYNLINGKDGMERYSHYHQALQDEDNDITESQYHVCRLINDELDSYGIPSALKYARRYLVYSIVTKGDWSVIEGCVHLSSFIIQRLIQTISTNADFELIKKYRHTPTKLQASALREVELVLVNSNLPSFVVVKDLADRIVEDRSVFHVTVSEAISDQTKRSIQDKLLDGSQCPKFVEYVAYLGVDLQLLQHQFRDRVLEEARKRLPEVKFSLLNDILNRICQYLSFGCIHQEKRLASLDYQTLKAILNDEENNLLYEFDVVKAVRAATSLLKKIEELFKASHSEINPIDVRNLSILKRVVRDFLVVDGYVSEEVSYDSVSVGELLKDPAISQLLEELSLTEYFQEFRKHYPLLLFAPNRQNLLEKIFEKYVVSKGVRYCDVKDLYRQLDASDDGFKKKLERLSIDNEQLLRNVTIIQQQCLGWEVYKEREIFKKAKKLREGEINFIRYYNFINRLPYLKEFSRLHYSKVSDIMQALKKGDLGVLQYEDDVLSRNDKQNVCLEIHNSQAFKDYFGLKDDETSKKFKDGIASLLPRGRSPTGKGRELFDMDFINSKAGDRSAQLTDKFRLFSGLRITKDQIKTNFHEEFIKAYLIRAERARRESVKSLIEEESTILANVINGCNRSLPDILHLLFTEGKCYVPYLPGLTQMTSKKFYQEYRSRPLFTYMKLILEELTYIDKLDAFKPPLCLMDAVRDHTMDIINELSTISSREAKTIDPPASINESRRFCQTHLPLKTYQSVLHDMGNLDTSNGKPKRLAKFVPQLN